MNDVKYPEHVHLAWRGALKACGVSEADVDAISEVVRSMLAETASATCEVCGGSGEYFAHAEDCNNTLCALNGDEHSCVGQVVRCDCADATCALRGAQIPDGWKLVPIDPTQAMVANAMKECGGIGAGSCGEHAGADGDDMRSVWDAMLKTTPTPEGASK